MFTCFFPSLSQVIFIYMKSAMPKYYWLETSSWSMIRPFCLCLWYNDVVWEMQPLSKQIHQIYPFDVKCKMPLQTFLRCNHDKQSVSRKLQWTCSYQQSKYCPKMMCLESLPVSWSSWPVCFLQHGLAVTVNLNYHTKFFHFYHSLYPSVKMWHLLKWNIWTKTVTLTEREKNIHECHTNEFFWCSFSPLHIWFVNIGLVGKQLRSLTDIGNKID